MTTEMEYAKVKLATLQDIAAETARQDRKWGHARVQRDGTGPSTLPLYSPAEFLDDPMTAEQLANTFKRRTNRRFRIGSGSWKDILLEEVFEALAESDGDALEEELVQVAAVCVSWVSSRRAAAQ